MRDGIIQTLMKLYRITEVDESEKLNAPVYLCTIVNSFSNFS